MPTVARFNAFENINFFMISNFVNRIPNLFSVHFRNFSTIHTGGPQGDVEVLAYVNSNLIVVHPESIKSDTNEDILEKIDDQIPNEKNVPFKKKSSTSSKSSNTKIPQYTQSLSEAQQLRYDFIMFFFCYSRIFDLGYSPELEK